MLNYKMSLNSIFLFTYMLIFFYWGAQILRLKRWGAKLKLQKRKVGKMKECDRKHGFRDRIIYYWTHKEPSTKYSFGCPPTSACFCWTFSQVSKFRVEFLQNGWKYPWFLLVSLVRPVQSLDVSGVLVRRPHHWVSCEYMNFE